MTKFQKYLDTGSVLIIFLTFILFTVALYFTGFTHDLLLEIAVFLVSVKLIIMSYKNTVSANSIQKELAEIRSLLQIMNKK